MRFSQSLATLAAACAASAGSLLTTAFADDVYDECLNASTSNAEWSVCGAEYLERLDGELNATWQRVFPELTDAGKALLRAEQRAWNAFKEASCLYYGNGDYGREGTVLHQPVCRGQIIEQRIEYLDSINEGN